MTRTDRNGPMSGGTASSRATSGTANDVHPVTVTASTVNAGTATVGLYAKRATGLVALLAALIVAILLSLSVGANLLPLSEVWRAIWSPGDDEASIIVWTMRAPRTVTGIVVGAAFGVAGALIQALTRNPLADPGILGVNAGAGFTVTVGVAAFGLSGISNYIWFAFLGAAAATVLVYLIGSAGRGSASPVVLVLAGVALAAVLGGVTSFLTLIDPDTFSRLRVWGLGSIARTDLSDTMSVLPFIIAGLLIAVLLSGSLNSVALGDDLAASLGTNIPRVRVFGIIGVTLLAGAGTALTGGIGFVGLMVPHIVRWIVGPDQRWIMLYSMIAAPVLVLVADVIGRVISIPNEVEVGLVTAIVGAPVLIALVRRKNASGL